MYIVYSEIGITAIGRGSRPTVCSELAYTNGQDFLDTKLRKGRRRPPAPELLLKMYIWQQENYSHPAAVYYYVLYEYSNHGAYIGWYLRTCCARMEQI